MLCMHRQGPANLSGVLRKTGRLPAPFPSSTKPFSASFFFLCFLTAHAQSASFSDGHKPWWTGFDCL